MLKLASKGHVGNQRNTMEKSLFHSFVISDQSVCQAKPSHSPLWSWDLDSGRELATEWCGTLWWIVQRSNLGQISWFAECSVSYFRSSVNIFQTQLPPIPISLQLKSEFTWNYLACLSLFILILLVSTPHFSCFFFYVQKFSVAQGWASVEQRGSNPGAPEAARAQWSAGHRRGLGHRGRSMSGQAMLQWRWGFESKRKGMFSWRIKGNMQ